MIDPEEGLKLEQVAEHLEKCQFQKYKCPSRCFERDAQHPDSKEEISGYALDHHLETCPFSSANCPICNVSFFRHEKG